MVQPNPKAQTHCGHSFTLHASHLGYRPPYGRQSDVQVSAKSVSRFNEEYKGKPIDLKGVDLSGKTIKKAVLAGADLRGADLTKTTFIRCDLTGADLSQAHLTKTRFELSTLEKISIVRTQLDKAHFRLSSIKRTIPGSTNKAHPPRQGSHDPG